MISIGLLLTALFVSCSHLGPQPCNAYQRRRNSRTGNFPVPIAAFSHHTHSNLGSKRTPSVVSPKLKRHHSPTVRSRSIALSNSSSNRDDNNNNSENEEEPKDDKKKTTPAKPKKYKFGDLTKSFVTKITKKDDYQFGDLSKYLDQQAKSKITQVTQKEDYEFGDLSRYIDSRVKDQVAAFANKEEYEFGDMWGIDS